MCPDTVLLLVFSGCSHVVTDDFNLHSERVVLQDQTDPFVSVLSWVRLPASDKVLLNKSSYFSHESPLDQKKEPAVQPDYIELLFYVDES